MKKVLFALLTLALLLPWMPAGAASGTITSPLPPNSGGSSLTPSGPFSLFLPAVTATRDSGYPWTALPPLNLEPLNYHDPQAILDASGRMHVFWDAWPGSGKQFIYHTTQTAQGWTEPQVVSSSMGISSLQGVPRLGPDGAIHLVWYNALSQTGPYRLLYASFAKNKWSPEVEIFRADTPDLEGRMNLDTQGNPHVAILVGGRLAPAYYYRARSASGWAQPVEMDPSFWQVWVLSWSPWPDTSGGVRFYGTLATDPSALRFLYWKDGAFQGDIHPFQGSLANPPGVLDSQDSLHFDSTRLVPVPGGNVYGLAYQCLARNLAWGTEVILSGQNAVSGQVQTGWDGGTRLVYGWQTPDSRLLELALVNGCPATIQAVHFLPQLPATFSPSWTVAAITASASPERVCVLLKDAASLKNFAVFCAQL